ncbi:class I SAM-dependent methyltransferase [Streptomyces sp. NRRL WC-3742]|uniref:class I SAM-dependent methyltransferase n=1 Tax=Streptomyces sp. NRRL WC-3742 TaxID=1463934 RepID=UPI0004CBDFA3|nr:class I SAM-dependent methyltransferase [Streptomyces sp. NRRL WC-3742]
MTRHLVNSEQSQAWNGYEGRHWSDHADRWNAVNGGFNAPLLEAAAVGPRDRVLDLGCGTGQTSRLAARTAGGGTVLGLDLSGPMLERARESAAREGLANLEFRQADVQVAELPEGGFDVAMSRFGVMFYQDPAAAFANVAAALRPGGRIAFVCMADPARTDWVHLFAALGDFTPPTGGEGPGMFSLADPGYVRGLLGGAGFEEVAVEPVEKAGVWGRDARDAASFLLSTGPAQHLLGGAAEQAREALTERLRAYEGAGGVELRTSAWLVTGVRRG